MENTNKTGKVSPIGGGQNSTITPMSPLVSAQNEHGEQLDKLGSLLGTLGNRLEPLRSSTPLAELSEGSSPSYSSVVNQICRQTDMVKSYQAIVSQILNELEV